MRAFPIRAWLRSLASHSLTHLASQVDSHTDNGSDGSVHALTVASAGEDGDSLSLVGTPLNKTLMRSLRHVAGSCGWQSCAGSEWWEDETIE